MNLAGSRNPGLEKASAVRPIMDASPRLTPCRGRLRWHDGITTLFRASLKYYLAGAPGFEPGNAGIKIRCLTTWRRPSNLPYFAFFRHGQSEYRNRQFTTPYHLATPQ